MEWTMKNKPKKWTVDDDNLLIDSFHTTSLEDIADKLGCSTSTVSRHARMLGLWKENRYGKDYDARAFIEMEFANLSYTEMAERLNMSWNGVRNIAKELGLVRTYEQKKAIMSRKRTELVKAERRRVIWGIDQKTDIKVVCNRPRLSLKQKLRQCGYIVTPGENIIYYSDELRRRPRREANGIKLGLKFMPLPMDNNKENYSQA